jgi:hypothetical protein
MGSQPTAKLPVGFSQVDGWGEISHAQLLQRRMCAVFGGIPGRFNGTFQLVSQSFVQWLHVSSIQSIFDADQAIE